MEVDAVNQITTFILEDVSKIIGKFAIACSEDDEGDGLGITANDFSLWVKRYGFAGEADIGSAHEDVDSVNPGFDKDGNVNGEIDYDFPPLDDFGNGIEQLFVCW